MEGKCSLLMLLRFQIEWHRSVLHIFKLRVSVTCIDACRCVPICGVCLLFLPFFMGCNCSQKLFSLTKGLLYCCSHAKPKDLENVVKDLGIFLGRSLDDNAVRRVVTGASLKGMRDSYSKQRCEDMKKKTEMVDMNVYINKG